MGWAKTKPRRRRPKKSSARTEHDISLVRFVQINVRSLPQRRAHARDQPCETTLYTFSSYHVAHPAAPGIEGGARADQGEDR